MLAHKIRVYPNKTMSALLEENFEYARRDYNRQLEILCRGIGAGKVTRYNLDQTLEKIRSYCLRHPDIWNKDKYHFPDIIGWNTKRIKMAAKELFAPEAKPKFKAANVVKKAFKVLIGGFDSHRVTFPGNKRLNIAGFGSIKMAEDLRFHSEPISVEFMCESGRYFAAVLFAETLPAYPKTGQKVGIDVGISTFATCVDENDKVTRYDYRFSKRDRNIKRINRYQRSISFKVAKHGKNPSSNRYKKSLQKLRNAYYHHTNKKHDFIEKAAHQIACDYDFIGLEHLNMKSMLKRHSVAKWYLNKPYNAFLSRVKSKATSVGKTVEQVDRNFPSSQLCSRCGYREYKVKDLSVREWVCPICGAKHDRDENAAKNILKNTIAKSE